MSPKTCSTLCLTTMAFGVLAISSVLLLSPLPASADERSDEEHMIVVEAGAAGEHDLSDGSTYFGPALGVEVEPIENWLELEFGASRFRETGATVWDFDLPVKKPFRLSDDLEVMPGMGPTWEHTSQPGEQAGSWGAEAVVDLFFWHGRRGGLFLEPAYGVAFADGRKSLTITVGIFVAVP